MSRDQRRRLLRQLRTASFTVHAGAASGDLTNGFPPRAYHVGWPEREAQALADWNRERVAIMAECAGRSRPWAYFWFDRPHAETIPGPQRDALLAGGRLTAPEAATMEYQHSLHAFGRIAASRPGETTADWLADPSLIEKSLVLLGWNVFTDQTIAHLRATAYPDATTKGDTDHA
jgi:hypothetical protein